MVVKKRVIFKNSVVNGWNYVSLCKKFETRPKKVDKWSRQGKTPIKGMEIPVYSSSINGLIPLKKPWSLVQGSYPGIIVTNEVHNVQFHNFGVICNVRNTVVTTNPHSSDGQHPVKFTEIQFFNVA